MARVETVRLNLSADVVYKPVVVHVPKTVDRFIRALCELDGSSLEDFYQEIFIGALVARLNEADSLLDLVGAAEKFQLNKAGLNLDPSMYGKE